MSSPRIEIDLEGIESNARALVERLGARGIGVSGVTKATLGSGEVGAAMWRGGVRSLADSRVSNLRSLRGSGLRVPLSLIRSPMIGEVGATVAVADVSFNSEAVVLGLLSQAAVEQHRVHGVVLMVELGDLREGVMPAELVALAGRVLELPGLRLAGIGTNLACQCGVTPDEEKMAELSTLAEVVEHRFGVELEVVSGGNSANLQWALSCAEPGRVNELRLGEAILLGTDPLTREAIDGLSTGVFTLVAEVIESQVKPAQPWGSVQGNAFGTPGPRWGVGTVRQSILAIGHQDVDPAGLVMPPGLRLLGASSDHVVVATDGTPLAVGDEVRFGVDYSALLRAMTSPFVEKVAAARPVLVGS